MCKRLLGDNNISSQLLLLNGYFNICIARGADATPSDPFSVLFSAGAIRLSRRSRRLGFWPECTDELGHFAV
jgi:hypothetical protein